MADFHKLFRLGAGVRWPAVAFYTMVVLVRVILLSQLPSTNESCQFEGCFFKASALVPGPQLKAVPHFAGSRDLEISSMETGHREGFLLHLESNGCSSFPPLLVLFVLCLCLPHLFLLCSYVNLRARNTVRRTVRLKWAAGRVLDEVTHSIARWG